MLLKILLYIFSIESCVAFLSIQNFALIVGENIDIIETSTNSLAVSDVTDIIEDEGKEDNLDDKVTGSTTSATNGPEDELTTKINDQVISEGKTNK